MRKYILISFTILNLLLLCSYSISIELPGVSTKDNRSFGLWNVSVLNEDNISFVQIESNIANNLNFRVLLGKPNILYYQLITPNDGVPHKTVESGSMLILINGTTNQVQCKVRAYGPWLTNFLNLPDSFLKSMSTVDNFGVQFFLNTPPIIINTMGFDSALKYAKSLLKKLKPIPDKEIKFNPF